MVQGKEAKKSHFCGGSLTGKRRVVARKHQPASVYWGPPPSLRPTSIPTFMRAETWQATNTADSRPDSLPGKYLSGAQPGFHSSISALWLSSGLANSEPAINGCLLINTHLGNTIKNNFKEKRKLWNYQAEAGTEIKPTVDSSTLLPDCNSGPPSRQPLACRARSSSSSGHIDNLCYSDICLF